ANCSANARLTVGGAVTLGPDNSLSLSSVTCGNTATLDAGTNTITSPKAITSFAGAGGGRQIVGNVVSGGTITVDQPLTISGGIVNTGAIAANKALTVDRNSATWLNQGA